MTIPITAPEAGETTQRILIYLEKSEDPQTPNDVAIALGITRGAAKMALHRLYQKREIQKVYRGQYITGVRPT